MYRKIGKLAEVKGHSEVYFINGHFHPGCVNTIRLDKVDDKYKDHVTIQLRKWLREGKLYKKK